MSAFAEKIAVVTGAASGIGKEMSRALLARGARVVLTDVDAARLDEARAELENGGKAEAEPLDVTDPQAVAKVVQGAVDRHGRIDFLFNNAGVAIFGSAEHMTLDDWNRLIDVNIRGVVHGVAAAYPIMVRQGHGHIVNTASAAGLAPVPGGTGYGMTKHAVVGLSTSLRAEASRHGVRVSAICPGFIRTPLIDSAKLINVDRESALNDPRIRFDTPERLAEAVMRGIERNRALIVFTPFAHVGWRLYRLAPSLMDRLLALNSRRNPLLSKLP